MTQKIKKEQAATQQVADKTTQPSSSFYTQARPSTNSMSSSLAPEKGDGKTGGHFKFLSKKQTSSNSNLQSSDSGGNTNSLISPKYGSGSAGAPDSFSGSNQFRNMVSMEESLRLANPLNSVTSGGSGEDKSPNGHPLLSHRQYSSQMNFKIERVLEPGTT